MTTTATKHRLIEAAAVLFRRKGYDGVGLSEILTAADAPKGSLYHHFPNGKSDLAIAAARWASEGMLGIIDDAFRDAPSFNAGATTLCYKIAKFFDLSGGWDGCPVSSILLDGASDALFREASADFLNGWNHRVADHAERLGLAPDEARIRARQVMIGIEGAWVMCRSEASSDPLREIPDLFGFRADQTAPPGA